ncbi:hypothetical protein ACFORG_05570 [Lutimaribacter marinistellae]|uniref:Uncharacterized protein n=1 Tax=Lutimaribacter marinistellae TaxID=1820329 RepID=A0ABV7TGJ6_9RHOB
MEDEFLVWKSEIEKEHQRLANTVELKLRKLRYLMLLGLPFVVLPLLFVAFFSEGFSLTPLVWMAIGIAIMGVCAELEQRFLRPVGLSQHFLATCTMETFLEQRSFRMLEE